MKNLQQKNTTKKKKRKKEKKNNLHIDRQIEIKIIRKQTQK